MAKKKQGAAQENGAMPDDGTAPEGAETAANDENTSEATAVQEVPATVFVLTKNHGLHGDGRTCEFFEAGREFDPVRDAALIARLARSGAPLEQK